VSRSGLVASLAGDFPADEFALSLNPIACHQVCVGVIAVLCLVFLWLHILHVLLCTFSINWPKA